MLSPKEAMVEAATDGEDRSEAHGGPDCRALCSSEQGPQNRGVHIFCCDFSVQAEFETGAARGMGIASHPFDSGGSYQARHKISKFFCSIQRLKKNKFSTLHAFQKGDTLVLGSIGASRSFLRVNRWLLCIV